MGDGLGRGPRQGRGALPRRGAARAGARGRRRGDRRRLGLAATGRSRSLARRARRCTRSPPTSSATAARATSRQSSRAATSSRSSPRTPRRRRAGSPRFARGSRSQMTVGVVFGPHLPRAGHEPDDRARADRVLRDVRALPTPPPASSSDGDPTFLSNVNAAYRRECWEALRFDDVPYSEDQAFGRALAADGALAQGLPPPRRRAARARLRRARVHAPLLRRVPRAARHDRSCRGLRPALDAARGARAGRRGSPFHDRARALATRASALDSAGDGPPRRAEGVLGCRLARGRAPACRSACAFARAPWCRRRVTAAADEAPRRRPAAETKPRGDGRGAARGPRPAAGAVHRHVRPRSGFTSRSPCRSSTSDRAATTSSSSSSCGSSGWATRAASGCTTRSRTAPADGPAALRGEIRRALRAGQGSGVQGLRSVVRRRRRRCHGVADRPARAAPRAAAARVRISSTTTSPSSTATSLEGEWAEETYRQGLYGIAGSPWLRDLYVERYGGSAGLLPVRRRPRRLPPATDRPPPATPSSSTRGTAHRGVRSRLESSHWRGCTGGARTSASSCSAIPNRSAPASPTSTRASWATSSSRGSSPRPPSGSRSR